MQIEGRNPVLESLRSQQELKIIYIKEGIDRKDTKIAEILKRAKKYKINTKFIPKKRLDKISKTGIHQGVIAKKAFREKSSLYEIVDNVIDAGEEAFFLCIRESHNEYNVGSVMRSAETAGVNALILPVGLEVNEQIVRASMGASEHLTITNEGVFQAIKVAKSAGIKVVGVETTGSSNYFEADLTGPVMIIIGGEDRALSKEVLKRCDLTVKIPLKGKINSLNMGVAAGLVLYERVRQSSSKPYL